MRGRWSDLRQAQSSRWGIDREGAPEKTINARSYEMVEEEGRGEKERRSWSGISVGMDKVEFEVG